MNNREAFEALEQNKGKFLPRTETGYRDTFVDRDYKMFCLGLKAFAEANICSRSHPHDDMSETCKWLSVEAKNACLASHQVELSSNTLQLQSQAQQPTQESVNKLRDLADQCKVAASCLTYNGARAEAVAKHLLLEASQGLRRSQAQQSSQWISVEDRLPEMETPVVALVGKNVYALARVDYDEGWLWAICGCDLSDIRDYEADDDYQPTYWMPLAIPPAPEGGDK